MGGWRRLCGGGGHIKNKSAYMNNLSALSVRAKKASELAELQTMLFFSQQRTSQLRVSMPARHGCSISFVSIHASVRYGFNRPLEYWEGEDANPKSACMYSQTF